MAPPEWPNAGCGVVAFSADLIRQSDDIIVVAFLHCYFVLQPVVLLLSVSDIT
jgi:hypothetical protein